MTDRMPHNVFITLRISYLPRMSLGIIHTLMMASDRGDEVRGGEIFLKWASEAPEKLTQWNQMFTISVASPSPFAINTVPS